MPDEIYDIYDDNGNKTRTATWTEVHAKGLIHRTTAVLVFKCQSRKELLIQRRNHKMEQDPGLWQHSAGGHIISGDTPQDAVKKELKEELFANHELPDIEIREISYFLNQDLPNNKEILHLFETIYSGPFYYDEKELAEEPRWIGFDRLLKDMEENPKKYTHAFRNVIKEYMKLQKKEI